MNDPNVLMAKEYFKSFTPHLRDFFPGEQVKISIREREKGEKGAILEIIPPKLLEIAENVYNKKVKSKQCFDCGLIFEPSKITTNSHNDFGMACIFLIFHEVQEKLYKDQSKEVLKKTETIEKIVIAAGDLMQEKKFDFKSIRCRYLEEKGFYRLTIFHPVKKRRKRIKRFSITGKNQEEIINLLEKFV